MAAKLKRLFVRPAVVAVSGGRDYKSDTFINHTLDFVNEHVGIRLLIEGGCPVGDGGADERARKWAKRNEVNCLSVPAKSKQYGWPACGPKRNHEIGEMKPELWVLFPGGKGTLSARKVAEEKGIARIEIANELAYLIEGWLVTSGEADI